MWNRSAVHALTQRLCGQDERKDSSAGAGGAAAGGAATTDPPEADAPRQTYQLMVKIGDDIRQDQLILQLIRLIDFQLKRLNIDLKLSPYPVLATSYVCCVRAAAGCHACMCGHILLCTARRLVCWRL